MRPSNESCVYRDDWKKWKTEFMTLNWIQQGKNNTNFSSHALQPDKKSKKNDESAEKMIKESRCLMMVSKLVGNYVT